jgi:hypothetical protein
MGPAFRGRLLIKDPKGDCQNLALALQLTERLIRLIADRGRMLSGGSNF